jgi:PAS domain S-box-containing protein
MAEMLWAFAGLLVATLIRWGLHPWLQGRGSGLYFVAAVAASWFSGWLAGLLTLTVGALLATVLFLPAGYFGLNAPENVIGLMVYLIVGGLIVAMVSAQHVQKRRADENAGEAAQRREWLDAVLASIVDAVIVVDNRDHLIEMNAAAENLCGWPRLEALGRKRDDVAKIVGEDTFKTVEQEVFDSTVEQPNRVKSEPAILLARDGRRVPVDIRATPIREAGSGISGHVLILRDETQRRADERALRDSERRFRLMADTAPVFIWICGPDRICNYFNKAWLDFTGREVGSELGVGWADGMHPVDRQRCLATYASAYESRLPFTMDYRLRRADGEYRWILETAVPRTSDDGEFEGYIGSCVDITERRQIEEELAAVEERLRLAVEGSGLGHWFWDFEERILEWSERSAAMMGLEANDAPTLRSFLSSVHRSDREQLRAEIREAIRGQERFRVEFRTQNRDGTQRWIQILGCAYMDQDGKPARMTGVALDVTELRRAEASLREADRRKDEFMATLAHELRNPLSAVRSHLDALKLETNDPRAIQKALPVMERQVAQLVRLIDDLMDLSRINRGTIELQRTHVALNEAMGLASEISLPALRSRGHRFEMKLPDPEVHIDADPARIAQVLSNLLFNSAKYTDPGGLVTLSAELRGGVVVVSVRDTGIGIPRDQLEAIFEPFLQVEGTKERAQGGLGLGLTLVKQIVELHGGQVRASSHGPGLGSTIEVQLPVVATPAAKCSGQNPDAESASRSSGESLTRKVLVADDNMEAAHSLAHLLRLLGHEVRVVYDGKAALEAVVTDPPDLALLDLGMPNLSGHDVAREARRHKRSRATVLVAITGWGRAEDRAASREAGFHHHVVKPVELETLIPLLEQARQRDET